MLYFGRSNKAVHTQNILNFLKETGLHLKPHVLEKPGPDAVQHGVSEKLQEVYLRLDFSGVGAKPQRAVFHRRSLSMG